VGLVREPPALHDDRRRLPRLGLQSGRMSQR
jgi:hypothetical protein